MLPKLVTVCKAKEAIELVNVYPFSKLGKENKVKEQNNMNLDSEKEKK